MFEVPETRYAKSGDVNIAYQVVGDGPFDLVHVPAFVSNLELQWEDPAERRYFERLASFCRLIMFDKRGTGLSDRVAVATLEERMDDLRAVMDAAARNGPPCMEARKAARFRPFRRDVSERVSALVLYGAYPRIAWAPDFPDGIPDETLAYGLRDLEENWGRGQGQGSSSPSHRTGPTIPPGRKRTAMGAPLGKPGSGFAIMQMNCKSTYATSCRRSGYRRSLCIGRRTSRTPRAAAIWVRTSPAPKSSD